MLTKEKEALLHILLNEVEAKSGIPISTDPVDYVTKTQDLDIPEYASYFRPGNSYDDKEQLFFLCSFKEPRVLEIFFHELGHATGPRLKRHMRYILPKDYSTEEIIAELTAFKLLVYFNLADEQQTIWCREYVNMHLDKHSFNISEVKKCHQEADKAFEYILNNWLSDFNKDRLERKVG